MPATNKMAGVFSYFEYSKLSYFFSIVNYRTFNVKSTFAELLSETTNLF